MKLYRTRTQVEYDWLMERLEEEGGYWRINIKQSLTEKPIWNIYRDRTVVRENKNVVSYSNLEYYKESKQYSREPIIEVRSLMQEPFPRLQNELTREKVNHPDHYQGTKYEVIDIIEDYDLGFHLGNVLKYVLRSEKKDNREEDLKKALWYLERELDK